MTKHPTQSKEKLMTMKIAMSMKIIQMTLVLTMMKMN